MNTKSKQVTNMSVTVSINMYVLTKSKDYF